jgi:hypothetical protein
MSAEMKRSSREGAESFRLIDEALGVHLSRPLTRILTQEFPAFAKGLQSIIGVGIVGAIGVAGVELFEKIAKGIEHAQKAQEEFAEATRKTGQVFSDAMASYEKVDKLRSLSGIDKKLFEIDYSAVEEGKKKVDELADALEKESKAAAEAKSPWTQLLATLGEGWHVFTSLNSTLGAETINKQLTEFKQRYDDLSRIDALNQTHYGAAALERELDKAKTTLATMESMKLTGLDEAANALGTVFRTGLGRGVQEQGFSQKELDAQNAYIAGLAKIDELQKAAGSDTTGRENEAKREAAAENQAKIAASTLSFYRGISAEWAKLDNAQSPLAKIESEFDAVRTKAITDFDAMRKAGASALDLHEALEQLSTLESNLDAARKAAIAAADVTTAEKGLPAKIAPTGSAPVFTPSNLTPTLGPGGGVGAAIGVFSGDQTAQLKAAAAAYQDLLTPADRYKIAQGELNILLEKGLIDQNAYTAALQKAAEAASTATDRLEKLLAKTGDAGAGFQAFFLKLEVDGGRMGTFTFDLLNKGLQGFEDETVKLITTGKANWHGYFESITQEALKFMLNKEIGSFFQMLSGTSIGKALNIPGLAQQGGKQATAAMQLQAGTIMQTAAGMQLQAASLMAQGGGGAGGGGFFSSLPFAGGFASGTDYAPGGLSWIAEQGPELVNLPSGSSVTPVKAGGDHFDVRIDARGAELGVDEKIMRALQSAGPHIVMQAVANINEIQKRTPH